MFKRYKFIDLFAGIGGFHQALSDLGHECVYACEKSPILREFYKKNFKMSIDGDIRFANPYKIKNFDILCAGFPCQPFSKAGYQAGFKCSTNGNLFLEILRFIDAKKPKYVFLENVYSLYTHNKGKTFSDIKSLLQDRGYQVSWRIYSPTDFGYPVLRRRIFIVATTLKNDINSHWPIPNFKMRKLDEFLDKDNPHFADKVLNKQHKRSILIWEKLLKKLPKDTYIPSPLWATEFKANYPYQEKAPINYKEKLKNYRTKFGQKIDTDIDDFILTLPHYSQLNVKMFPSWKIKFIKQSRDFYEKHKSIIDEWIHNLYELPESHQKIEWNCRGESLNFKNKLISFRGSGIRIKKKETLPTLIASTSSQLPIIYDQLRYISASECLKVHNINVKNVPTKDNGFYRMVGNSVHPKIVYEIGKSFFGKNINYVKIKKA